MIIDSMYGHVWRSRSLEGLPFKRCDNCDGRGIVVAVGYVACFDECMRLPRPGTWCLPCEGRGLVSR